MSTTVQYRSNAVLHETAGAEAAFLRLRPKYVAMRSTQLAYFNLAMNATLSTLRAVVPKVQELRPALAQLYEFNITSADELSDATLGLEYAHSQVMIRTHPSDDLEDLNREAIQTRDRFLHDQHNLAKNGVIDPNLLSQSTGSTGYKSVVTDIRTCIAVYRAIGAPGAAKSCCTVEERIASATTWRIASATT